MILKIVKGEVKGMHKRRLVALSTMTSEGLRNKELDGGGVHGNDRKELEKRSAEKGRARSEGNVAQGGRWHQLAIVRHKEGHKV